MSRGELARHLNLKEDMLAAWEEGKQPIQNPELIKLALQSVEGNVREQFFRQMLQILNESLQSYPVTEGQSSDSAATRR
jgi:hypothetical protein